MTETERQMRKRVCPDGHVWLEHRAIEHGCPTCHPTARGHWCPADEQAEEPAEA